MNDRGLPANSVASVRQYMRVMLASFGERECDQIVTSLFRHIMGWSKADLIMRIHDRLSESEILSLHKMAVKIRDGMPLQYAMGTAYFMGREFRVDPRVLIPRPETEELVQLVLDTLGHEKKSVLDIGTGSGCIAISLKLERENWSVDAVDISSQALELASSNAHRLGAKVDFSALDILTVDPGKSYDAIVSNPPYIASSESGEMQPNVLDYEPHLALFVPDNDPLVFYRRIAETGTRWLNPGGFIFVECNERLASETADIFRRNYTDVRVLRDLQERPRMVFARLG
jgi:release factor glutamine methyltransferase